MIFRWSITINLKHDLEIFIHYNDDEQQTLNSSGFDNIWRVLTNTNHTLPLNEHVDNLCVSSVEIFRQYMIFIKVKMNMKPKKHHASFVMRANRFSNRINMQQ